MTTHPQDQTARPPLVRRDEDSIVLDDDRRSASTRTKRHTRRPRLPIDTTRQEGTSNDSRRGLDRQPRDPRAARLRAHFARHRRRLHALRHLRRAGRRGGLRARPPVPDRDLHGHRGAPGRQARPRAARARPRRGRAERPGHAAHVLERRGRDAALPRGGPPRAPDVRACSRRQDEPEGHARALRPAVIAKHQFDVVRALVLVFVRRRDLMTLPLIVMLALNAAFTWLILVASGAESYLQLRYNMRAMPIALAGVAWLFLLSRGRQRLLVWA